MTGTSWIAPLILLDARNSPRWDESVDSKELISPEPAGVGSSVLTKFRSMGRDYQHTWDGSTRVLRESESAMIANCELSRADGELGGLVMHPLDGAGLLLGPRQQGLEALRIGLARAQESAPKRLLGVDPREQSLKFEQPAERRVAAEPPVGLQAANLLGSPNRARPLRGRRDSRVR